MRKKYKNLLQSSLCGLIVISLSQSFAASSPKSQISSDDLANQMALNDFKVSDSVEQIINSGDYGNLIGWVPVSKKINSCGGFYIEPALNYSGKPMLPFKQAPVQLAFDKGTLSKQANSTVSGNVVVTQPGRQLNADTLYIYRNPTTKKIDKADAVGHVYIREPGLMLAGDKGHFNLVDKTGRVWPAVYRYAINADTLQQNTTMPPMKDAYLRNFYLSAWGNATEISQDKNGIIHVKTGTLTTCPPKAAFWRMRASTINLNQTSGRGSATNARVELKGVPIFYTPYMNFPINDKRQTGFLYPMVGYSSDSGFELSVPFYWNIAPNHDYTITPNIYTSRGIQLQNQFRYLTKNSKGQIEFDILPEDQAFKSFKETAPQVYSSAPTQQVQDVEDDGNTRYMIAAKNNTQFNKNWSANLDYTKVSDENYLQDFGDSPTQMTDNALLQEGDVQYHSAHWSVKSMLQAYQTLSPLEGGGFNYDQYARLPELDADAYYGNLPGGFDFRLNSQYVYFYHSDQINPATNQQYVTGQRIMVAPTVSEPIQWASGYIKPTVTLSSTQYILNNPGTTPSSGSTPGTPLSSTPTRILPIVDLDTGLYFDRNMKFLGNNYTQTLEPRLFYLYVPYDDQSNLPNFDSSEQFFSYSQLFATNRFSGYDRIGDANQVSLALTSRFLNSVTGQEKLRMSVGEIIYFENRRVTDCEGGQNPQACVNNNGDTEVNALNPTAPVSPIVGELDYHFNRAWLGTASYSFDPNVGKTYNSLINLQYKRDNRHIINLGYSFLRGGDVFQNNLPQDAVPADSPKNNLNQTNVSIVWPLLGRFSTIAQWNYNFSHGHPQTVFGGLQYDSCCWSARLIGSHTWTGLDANDDNQFDNQVYFQFFFKGLGALGSNTPTSMLETNVPGYRDQFGKELV